MNKKYLKIALISNIIFEPYIYSAISCVFEKLSVIPLLVTISFEEYFEQSSIESLLNVDIIIVEAKDCELARIAELTQRTNKCTNGVRYTFDELKTCFEDPNYNLFSVFLSDRFSNLGLVGVIGIKYEVIDLFSLSCRALGRNIDNEMLGYVKKCGTKWFRFSSTGKNLAVQHLFKECKFKIKNI